MKRHHRLAGLLASMALLLAATPVARAADDPQPVEWPRAEAPSTDAQSDPAPVDWPRPEKF